MSVSFSNSSEIVGEIDTSSLSAGFNLDEAETAVLASIYLRMVFIP
jgi:hypothetical protein